MESEDKNEFVLKVHNPMSHIITSLVRIPITNNNSDWIIIDQFNVSIQHQVTPVPKDVINIPGIDIYETIYKSLL